MRTDSFLPTTPGGANEPFPGVDGRSENQFEKSELSALNRGAAVAGRWLGEHPVVCVAIGMGLGVTVGWLIKRK